MQTKKKKGGGCKMRHIDSEDVPIAPEQTEFPKESKRKGVNSVVLKVEL